MSMPLLFSSSPRSVQYIKRMRDNIAQSLGISIDRVSVKATTSEELGSVGMGEGAATHAIALIAENQLRLNI